MVRSLVKGHRTAIEASRRMKIGSAHARPSSRRDGRRGVAHSASIRREPAQQSDGIRLPARARARRGLVAARQGRRGRDEVGLIDEAPRAKAASAGWRSERDAGRGFGAVWDEVRQRRRSGGARRGDDLHTRSTSRGRQGELRAWTWELPEHKSRSRRDQASGASRQHSPGARQKRGRLGDPKTPPSAANAGGWRGSS